MTRLKLNNGIIIFVIVALVGGAAYYILNSQKIESTAEVKTTNSLPTNQATIQPTPTSQAASEDSNKQILQDIVGSGVNCNLTDANGNVIKDSCKVDKVSGNYAKGTMPQAYWIALKANNKWKVVITGNGIPQCTEIDKNSIPKEIFGNCIEDSGNLRY